MSQSSSVEATHDPSSKQHAPFGSGHNSSEQTLSLAERSVQPHPLVMHARSTSSSFRAVGSTAQFGGLLNSGLEAMGLSMLAKSWLSTPGLALVVLALIFVVRPLTVFISSINSDLNTNEKMFISYISPRGIVAASIASLIGIELKNRGIPGGESIQGLVFLTIAITVLFQGLTARTVSKILKVTVDTKLVVIVGANALGRLMGKLLLRENMEISLIDTNDRSTMQKV